MTSTLRGEPQPPIGSMLQDVIDNVREMVRREMTPTPPPQQVEGNWVVGFIGRRPHAADGKPRLILVEHVPRGGKRAGVPVRALPPRPVPARAAFLSGFPVAGTAVRGSIRVQGAVLAVDQPDLREFAVDRGSIERGVTTHEEPMTAVTNWRDRATRRPWVTAGVALGGGILISRIVRSAGSRGGRDRVQRPDESPGPQRPPTQVSQTWDQIKAALLAAAAVEVFEWIGDTMPTLQETFVEGMRHGPLAERQ